MPTLRLADYLQEDLVLWDLPCLDKQSFLKAFAAQVAARLSAVEERTLLDRLLAREEQQSTGIGGGLALPHVTLPGLDQTRLVVGRVGDNRGRRVERAAAANLLPGRVPSATMA